MGEPSDINANGAAPAEGKDAAPANRGDGLVSPDWWPGLWGVRHWRGNLPLGVAFWGNGVLLGLAIVLLERGLRSLRSDEWAWMFSEVMEQLFLFPALAIWQAVGIWRSAVRFARRSPPDGPRVDRWLWPVAASLAALAWLVWYLRVPAIVFPGAFIRQPARLMWSIAAGALVVARGYHLPIHCGFRLYSSAARWRGRWDGDVTAVAAGRRRGNYPGAIDRREARSWHAIRSPSSS